MIGNFPRDKAAATEHRGDNWFHHVPIINATYRYDSEAGKKLMKNQEGNRGFVDEVIMPRMTRKRIARAFASLRGKKAQMPWKKHDNIPL